MQEFRHKSHLPIDRALTRKVAKNEFKEAVASLFSYQVELLFVLETTFSTGPR